MRYLEIPPPADLAADIECFWSLRGRNDGAAPPQPVYPDGCSELILHLGEPFAEVRPEGRTTQSAAFVVGPMSRPLVLAASTVVDTIGARFRPGSAVAFFREPLGGLESSVALEAAWGAEAGRLAERVAEAPVRERFDILTHELRGRRRASRAPWITPAVRAVLDSEGRLAVGALERRLGVGARRLERGFRDYVGLSPKVFARIVRFQSVFRRLGDAAPPDWIDIALDSGYFDQSHLIREFKNLAGVTPGEHVGSDSLARLFTSSDRLAGYFRMA